MDVVVVGAGPAGLFAALRAADLGARTTLVTNGAVGGMAATDGPVPVRTLAHAARLLREARQLPEYGIDIGEPRLDYSRLLARVGDVVDEVRRNSTLRTQLDAAGVRICEAQGAASFVDATTIATEAGLRLTADRFILCTGGESRRLPIPGFELAVTPRAALSLAQAPQSMIVIGGGATGLQVASIFAAFGTKVHLFQAADRILPDNDEDVSRIVAEAFRARDIQVHEGFGTIDLIEAVPDGVRMTWSKAGASGSETAELIVSAVGWSSNAEALNLAAAGIAVDDRGFIEVDSEYRTSVPHIFAAGDIIGRAMLVPQAIHGGFHAASAAMGKPVTAPDMPVPVGSFTDPEYAHVGLTEAAARAEHDVEVASIFFNTVNRAIIDGRTTGFCKLIVDRNDDQIVGCHVVGDRAVDIVQVAALAMAGRMPIDTLAHFPLSFPIYAGILGQAAATIAHRINRSRGPSSP